MELVEGELALTKAHVEHLTERPVPGQFPTVDAEAHKRLQEIEARLVLYLSLDQLEAARIMGVTPFFYVLEWIDLHKETAFAHPKGVLVPIEEYQK